MRGLSTHVRSSIYSTVSLKMNGNEVILFFKVRKTARGESMKNTQDMNK